MISSVGAAGGWPASAVDVISNDHWLTSCECHRSVREGALIQYSYMFLRRDRRGDLLGRVGQVGAHLHGGDLGLGLFDDFACRLDVGAF